MSMHAPRLCIRRKDLGITVTESIKSPKQCYIAAAKANRILGIIQKNFLMLGRYRVNEVV